MGFKKKAFDETEQIEGLQENTEDILHEEVDLSLEEQEEQLTPEEERREVRRQRRKRNELLATTVALMAVAVLATGAFAGVKTVSKLFKDRQQSSQTTETSEDIRDMVQDILASETELPTEIVETVSPEEQLDAYIDTVLAGMTLEEKVAGLIITSPEGLTGVARATRAGEGTQTALQKIPVGGLVYYRQNIESAEQFEEMLTNTASYSKYPLFMAVNEGGDKNSSIQSSVLTVPDVKKPGELQNAEEAYSLGSTIGSYLSTLHFNLNLAPTADILYADGAAVKDYCFGGDAALNAELTAAYVKGLEENGVSAAIKTFPGTGHLTGSTADGNVSTNKTKEQYTDDFSVFKAGIDAGADFIMVSNIVAPELSGATEPCSMSSSVVTDILRKELGFNGIVITEPMNGKAITEYYSASEAAVAALKAGCDMILLPEKLEETYQGILDAVANGTVAEARINDSLKRVLRVKYAEKLQEFS